MLHFGFIVLKCEMQVKSFEVLNETLESQEARYENADDYLRARKTNRASSGQWPKYRICDDTKSESFNLDEINI